MPAKRDLQPGMSPLHFLGAEIRRAREAAGLSLADLGALVPCDASTVSRIEAGLLTPSKRCVAACVERFPQLEWIGRFYEESPNWDTGAIPSWFLVWLEMEGRATVIRQWEPLLVPGLLQTPDYARAVLGWGPDNGPDLDDRVAARMERQRIFDGADPPEVWMLLSESVLGYRVGSADIMRKQIDHLSEMAARPRVTVQVLPCTAGAHGGLSGAFAIGIDPPDTVLYLETGVEGMVAHDPRLIGRASIMFEHLRSEAIPRSQTREFLTRAGERWNS